MTYIVKNDQYVYGFEFGNELPKLDPAAYAADFKNLRAMINSLWPDASNRPKVREEPIPLANIDVSTVDWYRHEPKRTVLEKVSPGTVHRRWV